MTSEDKKRFNEMLNRLGKVMKDDEILKKYKLLLTIDELEKKDREVYEELVKSLDTNYDIILKSKNGYIKNPQWGIIKVLFNGISIKSERLPYGIREEFTNDEDIILEKTAEALGIKKEHLENLKKENNIMVFVYDFKKNKYFLFEL
jgi:hypothetical protein